MNIERHLHATGRGTLPYLFAPAADALPSIPLVVFLHGACDRGSDPDLLLAHGLPRHVAHAAELPYHFLAPQIPEGSTWTEWRAELLQLIDETVDRHRADRRRIVLAGFSAGSAAAWELAAAEAERFAGLVLVAGRVPDAAGDAVLGRLGHTPVWFFHGERDERAPVAPVEAAVSRLHALGVPVRFTLYPDAGHAIADAAYGDSTLQRWLATVPRRSPSAPRVSQREVDPLFLNRWSPRALRADPIDDASLLRIIEAARWAPSASNSQPWRFLYVRNGAPLWDETVELLSGNNRLWAPQASVLILLLSKTTFVRQGEHLPLPASNHSFDSGAAWAHLALQATLSGWHTRAIAGYDKEAARALFKVPDEYKLEILIALGRLGDDSALPEPLRERELPTPRRPLADLVAAGPFSLPRD